MKFDEFAFVNQQLAGMLQAGVPLEAGLKRLCATMRRGALQTELRQLERDLAAGQPLNQALAARKLPGFYRKMIQAGAQSNDLPGVLLLLGDYYQKVSHICTRLKGLMVYPLIVLLLCLGLSLFIAWTSNHITEIWKNAGQLGGLFSMSSPGTKAPNESALRQINYYLWFSLWLPPMAIFLVGGTLSAAVGIPGLRRCLQWRLPAFREAQLAQIAGAMRLMLQGGCTLNSALALAGELEAGTAAGRELGRWQQRCAAGYGKWTELTADAKVFPPLFLWLVASSGEDLAGGFQRAADHYQTRAAFHLEWMLYAALPVALLGLGLIIMGQMYPFISMIFGLNHIL